MLSRRSGERSAISFIIDEAIEAGDKLPRWMAIHKRRENNSAAHELAQLAKRSRHSAVWHFAARVLSKLLLGNVIIFLSNKSSLLLGKKELTVELEQLRA
jgi:hypothetical protein